MKPRKIYWDSSCFISYLSGDQPSEAPRASICEDVLNCARNEEISLYTSVWTIAETIRPKSVPIPEPLPDWTQLLNSQDKGGNLVFPDALEQASKLWNYFKKGTAPTRLLSDDQASRIRLMFDWKWIRLIQVVPAIAHKAVEIARTHNLKAGDSCGIRSEPSLRRYTKVGQRFQSH